MTTEAPNRGGGTGVSIGTMGIASKKARQTQSKMVSGKEKGILGTELDGKRAEMVATFERAVAESMAKAIELAAMRLGAVQSVEAAGRARQDAVRITPVHIFGSVPVR